MEQPDIIVSLWRGEPNTGQYLGCGVCIAPDLILTAKHVVESTRMDELHAGLVTGRDSGLPVGRIDPHPQRDIAVLTLTMEHRKPPVPLDLFPVLREGMEIHLLAYNKAEKCTKGPIGVCLSNRAKPNGWEFHTEPVPGMSGGAVLLGKCLVGIVQAQDDSENSGIMIPLDAIREFLQPFLPAEKANDCTTNSCCIPQSDYIRKQYERLVRVLGQNTALLPYAKAEYQAEGAANLASRMQDSLCAGAQQQDATALGRVRAMLHQAMQENVYSKELKQSAEELFVTALSMMVPENTIALQQPDIQQAHEIPVFEEQTLEPVAARIYGVTPQLAYVDGVTRGKYAHQLVFMPEVGWSAERKTDAIAEELFTGLGKGKTPFHKKYLRKLNAQIRSDRTDAGRLHYFAADDSEKNKHPLWNPDVVKILKSDAYLPNLPVFLYGADEAGFISEISGIIEVFMDDLNEYTAKAAH